MVTISTRRFVAVHAVDKKTRIRHSTHFNGRCYSNKSVGPVVDVQVGVQAARRAAGDNHVGETTIYPTAQNPTAHKEIIDNNEAEEEDEEVPDSDMD